MAPELDDELWNLIEPLLPRTTRRYRHPSRRRIDDRKVLSGILFVLSTGIAWQRLPPELGFGSGMTCWRRLRDWQQAGVWQRLHELLLAKLRQAERLDFSRAVCDSSSLRALLGAVRPDRAPSTAAEPAASTTQRRPARLPAPGVNRHDVMLVLRGPRELSR